MAKANSVKGLLIAPYPETSCNNPCNPRSSLTLAGSGQAVMPSTLFVLVDTPIS